MRKNIKIITCLILLGVTLLSACNGSEATNKQGPSNEEIIFQAFTQVAQTIRADMALTEDAKPLPTYTQIVLSSPTRTPYQPSPTTAFPTLAPLPSPTRTPNSSSIEYVGGRPCLRAQMTFETHVDGSVFKPNQGFIKVWKFINSGGCTWTGDFAVIWVGGPNLAGQGVIYLRDMGDFPPEGIMNGSSFKIRIRMQAPSTVGRYKSYWMLQDENGNLFGWGSLGNNAFWVDIKVRK